MSVSLSTTRLAMKLAPTVDVICDGLKDPLQYLCTSDVLPTPCEPSTTIFASSDDIVLSGRRNYGGKGREREEASCSRSMSALHAHLFSGW